MVDKLLSDGQTRRLLQREVEQFQDVMKTENADHVEGQVFPKLLTQVVRALLGSLITILRVINVRIVMDIQGIIMISVQVAVYRHIKLSKLIKQDRFSKKSEKR